MSELASYPVIFKFSGAHTGAAGLVTSFLADAGCEATTPQLALLPGYSISARVLRNLRMRCPANALAANLIVTVMKNGVATALTVTITPGSTALFSDLTNAVSFAAGDQLDIRLQSTGGLVAVATISGTVEGI